MSQLRLAAALAAAGSAMAAVPFTHRPIGFDGGGWVTGIVQHETSGLLYSKEAAFVLCAVCARVISITRCQPCPPVRTDVGGAYRSSDAGQTWSWLSGYEVGLPWSTQGLAVNQSDPSGLTVFIGVGDDRPSNASGVWKSTDGGESWVQVLGGVFFNGNGNSRQAAPCLAIDDARPWRVWAAAQQGLWLSTEGGDSWAPVTSFNEVRALQIPLGGSGC